MRTMKIRAFAVAMAILLAAVYAVAQSGEKPSPAQTVLSAAELERASSAVSLEQGILREAAKKVRASKTALRSVEVSVTVETSTNPNACGQVCWGSGLNKVCRPLPPCSR